MEIVETVVVSSSDDEVFTDDPDCPLGCFLLLKDSLKYICSAVDKEACFVVIYNNVTMNSASEGGTGKNRSYVTRLNLRTGPIFMLIFGKNF